MFDPINNHVQKALKRLLTQYQDAENLQGLLSAIISPLQEIEGVLADLNEDRMLSVATGVQLDNIGKIVGLARQGGQDDTSYRQDLYAEIKVNVSEGQPEQAISTYQLFTSAPLVIFLEWPPAAVSLQSEYYPADQTQVDQLLEIMQKVLPAGVRCDSLVAFDPDEAFAMDGSLLGAGFGDVDDASVGGKIATEFYRNTFFEMDGDDPTGAGFGSVDDPLVGGELET